jgi:uncharacterized protein involved in exopolysaccharide biosynthesis
MAHDNSLDIMHYFRMLWRRRDVILLASVTVVCASVVAIQFVPAEYESTATLRMEERRRLSRELEDVIGGGGGGGSGYRVDEARLDEMAARINSRPFLERVVRLLKMNEDPNVLETARKALRSYPDATVDDLAVRHVVNQLRKKIDFANTGMGNYQIIVADSDPNHAQLLTKWIAEMFVDFSQQSSLAELQSAHEFGAEQERIYQERLRQSELALERYRAAAIQTDLSQGFVRQNNVSRAEALQTQILDEVDLARLRLLPLSRSVTDAGLQGAADLVLNDGQVQNQLRTLRTQMREAVTGITRATESREGVSWPPGEEYLVVRRGFFRLIERRTDELHASRSAEERDLIGRYVFATFDYEEQADVAAFLGQAISEFVAKAQAMPRDEMELERLEAEVETNRSLLGSFRAQLIASDINQAMEITNLGMRVEILDPPQIPLQPARPDKMKILVAAFVLGPLLGIGIAFVSEILDPTLRTIEDFRRVFGGQVIGTAPLVHGGQQKQKGLRAHWKAATITSVLLLTVIFFVARATVLPDITTVHPSIQVVDPGSGVTP